MPYVSIKRPIHKLAVGNKSLGKGKLKQLVVFI